MRPLRKRVVEPIEFSRLQATKSQKQSSENHKMTVVIKRGSELDHGVN